MPTRCFMLEPTARASASLRRYSRPVDTHTWGDHLHDATTYIGLVDFPLSDSNGLGTDDVDHGDPRWPLRCACGYEFRPDDAWQHNIRRLYEPIGGGQPYTLTGNDVPVGAMWDAPWLATSWRGPDGRCLVLRTPGGDWVIDQPSRDGGHWTRTGTPPFITARPSILIPGRYHGWLTDGELSDDLDGNPPQQRS